MIGRGWFLMFFLGAALMPYLLSSQSPLRAILSSGSSPGAPQPAAAQPSTSAEGAKPAKSGAAATIAAAAASTVGDRQPAAPLEAPVTLAEALRWDLTPTWVMNRWPRVTTLLAELDLQGYRVPLVTGTGPTDVAGSLSYYFDATQQLRRIEFTGTTGDAHDLVVLLRDRHGFQRRLTEDPSTYLYQVEEDRRALSELRVRAAPVVKSGNPFTRFSLSLVMRRPEE